MIELIQFPWSPFCLTQRRILEFSGAHFKTTDLPPQERSLVWQLTKQRYYGVPVLRDGRNVVFETGDDSQVIAKYLDLKLKLDCSVENIPVHLGSPNGGGCKPAL
jgi:glutathione S-transferase